MPAGTQVLAHYRLRCICVDDARLRRLIFQVQKDSEAEEGTK